MYDGKTSKKLIQIISEIVFLSPRIFQANLHGKTRFTQYKRHIYLSSIILLLSTGMAIHHGERQKSVMRVSSARNRAASGYLTEQKVNSFMKAHLRVGN